jgi:hypothetical protein
MGIVNWFRALFTIEFKNIELGWPSMLFITLWRFCVMGFVCKWAVNVWLGIDLPFLFSTGHLYTLSKHPDGLFFFGVIFFGLCGLFLTYYITFWAALAGILMAFGVFDNFRNFFMMLFAFLILGIANLIFNLLGRIETEKKGIF